MKQTKPTRDKSLQSDEVGHSMKEEEEEDQLLTVDIRFPDVLLAEDWHGSPAGVGSEVVTALHSQAESVGSPDSAVGVDQVRADPAEPCHRVVAVWGVKWNRSMG